MTNIFCLDSFYLVVFCICWYWLLFFVVVVVVSLCPWRICFGGLSKVEKGVEIDTR